MVTIQFFKKNGLYFSTENIDLIYDNRDDLIKQLKNLKKEKFKNYTLLLKKENGKDTLPQLF